MVSVRKNAFVENRVLLLGSAGSVLVALGAFGAGATLLHDPVLAGTPFDALRYGNGRSLATAVLYLGVVLMLTAWVLLGHAVHRGQADTRRVLRAIGAWSGPLLLAPPLFSTDLYTYLAQGAVAHAGLDPYTNVPADVPGPIIDNAAGEWMTIPSPYGPLFILLVKSVVGVTGDNLILGALLTRLVIVIGLGLLCVWLPRLCRHLGARPDRALWIGVANPLVLLVLVAGAHNDLLMGGLLVAGTVFVLAHAPVRGFALVAMAVAVKVTAAVALPFLVWVWVVHRSRGQHPTSSGFARTTAAAVSIVVTAFGSCTLLAGVDLGWIGALSGNSDLEPWLSVPTALGKLTQAGLSLFTDVESGRLIAGFRLVGWGALATLVGWLWWRSRAGGATAVKGAAQALLATALLAPVTLPWYFTWSLALGAAVTWPATRIAAVAAISVWLTLSTHSDGKTLLPPWGFGAVLVASVLIGLALSPRRVHAPRGQSGTADGHEGAQGEVAQIQQRDLRLVTADAQDDRPRHDQRQPERGQRDQHRRDVQQCGQDQAHRTRDLDRPDGLHRARAEVQHPSGAGRHPGDLFPLHEQFPDAGDEIHDGQEPGDDPQCGVHECAASCPGR